MSPDMLKSPKYALVAQDDQVLGISPPTKPLLSKREIVIISISALLLLFSNGLWLVNIARDGVLSHGQYLQTRSLTLPDRISVPLHAVEDGLDSQELNVSDSHWEALFPRLYAFIRLNYTLLTHATAGAGVVALPPSYVKEKNLPASINDPESGKLLYVMSGYHTLHCLVCCRTSSSRWVRRDECFAN